MSRPSRPLKPGLGLALLILAVGLVCLAFSLFPHLSALAALRAGSFPESELWRLWLAPLSHPSPWEAALSAAGVGLALIVFSRRDMARAAPALLLGAPLCSALSVAWAPEGAVVGGLSASLFFMGSLISAQMALGPSRSWSERLVGGSCLFMLVSRAFFSLTMYEAEPLAGQAAIIARCAGAGLGLAFAPFFLAAQLAVSALGRAKRRGLGALG